MVTVCTYLFFFTTPNYNFSTLISDVNSHLKKSFPKCCPNLMLFSSTERKCKFVDFDTRLPRYKNLTTKLGRLNSQRINSGNSSSNSNIIWSSDTNLIKVEELFYYRSLNIGIENEIRHLERSTYCLEEDKERINPIWIVCGAQNSLDLSPNNTLYKTIFFLIFCTSLLLIVITFSIYIAIPELHEKVKGKCFICYLASLILNGIYISTQGSSSEIGTNPCFGAVSSSIFSFFLVMNFSWLNVMCIHLWRTVTAINPIPSRSFYAYVLYATGLPLTCEILFHVDSIISGKENFSRRMKESSLLSNPCLLYMCNVGAIQQFINLLIFARVGYIIWNQKRQWNKNRDSIRNKNLNQHNTIFFQLLKLFIITGLDWIYVFYLIYIPPQNFIFWGLGLINACPGYFIFIIYVCCNKRVTSLLRQKFSKIIDRNTINSTRSDLTSDTNIDK